MYRLLISFLLEGLVIGCGLALFVWIGQYRASWQTTIAMIAGVLLAAFVQLIPTLRTESLFHQIVKGTENDREKLGALLGQDNVDALLKKRPLVCAASFVLVIFMCLGGLIARLSR